MVEDARERTWPQAADRRVQPRLPVQGVALVRARGRAVLAEAVDITAHGVCLTLPRPLPVGSAYRLDLEIQQADKRSTSVVACVCFCLECKNGYRIGFNCSLAEFVE